MRGFMYLYVHERTVIFYFRNASDLMKTNIVFIETVDVSDLGMRRQDLDRR